MKKLLAAVLLLPSIALSQQSKENKVITTTKKVVCAELSLILKELEDAKEYPFWVGADEGSYYSLFVNKKSKEWTLVQFNQDFGCIIGVGGQHTHIFLPNS